MQLDTMKVLSKSKVAVPFMPFDRDKIDALSGRVELLYLGPKAQYYCDCHFVGLTV